jgi:protein SCO1/2
MIFTHCLYACPKTTENIIQLEKLIERPIKVVLVSFDPKRDTPDRMKSFLQKNNSSANWFLLTSHQDIIKRTSMLFDISFKELETGEFSHENIILLLDKKGREIKRIEGLSFNLHQEASEIIQLMDN